MLRNVMPAAGRAVGETFRAPVRNDKRITFIQFCNHGNRSTKSHAANDVSTYNERRVSEIRARVQSSTMYVRTTARIK